MPAHILNPGRPLRSDLSLDSRVLLLEEREETSKEILKSIQSKIDKVLWGMATGLVMIFVQLILHSAGLGFIHIKP